MGATRASSCVFIEFRARDWPARLRTLQRRACVQAPCLAILHVRVAAAGSSVIFRISTHYAYRQPSCLIQDRVFEKTSKEAFHASCVLVGSHRDCREVSIRDSFVVAYTNDSFSAPGEGTHQRRSGLHGGCDAGFSLK